MLSSSSLGSEMWEMALLATDGHPYEAELDNYPSLSFARKGEKTQSRPWHVGLSSGGPCFGVLDVWPLLEPVLYLEDSLPLPASLFLYFS